MMRIVRRVVVVLLFLAVISPVLPLPAEACSCAMPGDLEEWVDQSEAVFVGQMIEKIDGGQDPFGGPGAIYVFEVETWVKGDLGDVIEVHSAPDGAGCGFEFWDPDMRTGAAIYVENGVLNGGLCSQVDADVLLAAMAPPTPSDTGIPKLIVSNGWSSPRLTVLDQVGHQVTELNPPVTESEWAGTRAIDVCPERDLMVQMTEEHVIVWDLRTLEASVVQDVGIQEAYWPSDMSCRTADASAVWVLYGGETDSILVDVVSGEEVGAVPGVNGVIGEGFVAYQAGHDGDAMLLDLETGVEVQLTSKRPGSLVGLSMAPHPTDPEVAVLEILYQESGPTLTTLTIFDDTGGTVSSHEISEGEAHEPTWLDDSTVGMTFYTYTDDITDNSAQLIDVATGELRTIDDWTGINMTSDRGFLLGTNGGTVVTADLETGELGQLVTIPSQEAGPIVVIDSDEVVAPAPTTTAEPPSEPAPTTPPLVAPDLGEQGPGLGLARWIAIGAIVVVAVLFWLAFRRPTPQGDAGNPPPA